MAKDQFIINSRQTLLNFKAELDQTYGDGAYLLITVKKGKEATMPQKALVHIWFKQYAAYLYKKREKDVTKLDIDSMKRACKVRFYNETQELFMFEIIADPFHPDHKRKEMTSIATWSQGQCYQFMTWMQDLAMHGGLILESIGEHQRLTHESNTGVVDAE